MHTDTHFPPSELIMTNTVKYQRTDDGKFTIKTAQNSKFRDTT